MTNLCLDRSLSGSHQVRCFAFLGRDTHGDTISVGPPHLIIENAIWCHFFLDGLCHDGCHAPKEVHLSWIVLAVRSPAKQGKEGIQDSEWSRENESFGDSIPVADDLDDEWVSCRLLQGK
jgi:hypothetical protein